MHASTHPPPTDAGWQEQFQADLHHALKHWTEVEALRPLLRWHCFRMAADGDRENQRAGQVRERVHTILLDGLNELELENPVFANILCLHFLDGNPIDQVANLTNIESSTVYKRQAAGLKRLGKILWRDEQKALLQQRLHWEPHLESKSYGELIGMESALQQLYPLLCQPGATPIVAIEGIGGIGKTALADQLLRRLIDYSPFTAFAWVTAQQGRLTPSGNLQTRQAPALTTDSLIDGLVTQLTAQDDTIRLLTSQQKELWLYKTLRQQPHCLVLDNMETVSDVEVLLPLLQRWANPSKFILTSRHHVEAEMPIFHQGLSELSEQDSLRLVRLEASQRNIPALAQAKDETLHPIYETVGGNPLALRLVVGQCYRQDLSLVLNDLLEARGSKAETLYTFLYRHAWNKLDRLAQLTWMALPLVSPSRATAQGIATMVAPLFASFWASQSLSPASPSFSLVHQALDQLVRLNLVDAWLVQGEHHYRLHSLTRTFLHKQVVAWSQTQSLAIPSSTHRLHPTH